MLQSSFVHGTDLDSSPPYNTHLLGTTTSVASFLKAHEKDCSPTSFSSHCHRCGCRDCCRCNDWPLFFSRSAFPSGHLRRLSRRFLPLHFTRLESCGSQWFPANDPRPTKQLWLEFG